MMDQPEAARQAERAGLCGRCQHGQWIVSDRDAWFLRCGLSDTNPTYPRFPSLPVVHCAGFGPVGPTGPRQPDGPR